MFPQIASKQSYAIVYIKKQQTLEEKEMKLEAIKRNRASFNQRQRDAAGKLCLPTWNVENSRNIMDNIATYADDVPKYKSTPNTKINVVQPNQIEFEVNSDIQSLHEMFPNVGLQTIQWTYQNCDQSLNHTLEKLLVTPDITSNSFHSADEWPALLPQMDIVPASSIVDSSQEPVIDVSEGTLEVDVETDFVFVDTRSSTDSSATIIMNYDSDDWVYLDGEDDGCNTESKYVQSYRDILLKKCV